MPESHKQILKLTKTYEDMEKAIAQSHAYHSHLEITVRNLSRQDDESPWNESIIDQSTKMDYPFLCQLQHRRQIDMDVVSKTNVSKQLSQNHHHHHHRPARVTSWRNISEAINIQMVERDRPDNGNKHSSMLQKIKRQTENPLAKVDYLYYLQWAQIPTTTGMIE